MDRLLFSLFLSLSLTVVFAAQSQKIITVYGVENAMAWKVRDKVGFKYQLQIGAFKERANAIKCKNRFQNKTAIAIQIIPPKQARGSYLVVLGPLQNSLAIRTISKQLTGKNTLFAAKKAPVLAKKPVDTMPSENKLVAEDNQAKTEQMAHALENSQNLEQESEKLTMEALNQESVANDLKLKMATDPEQIIALQKRQIEISQELESNVTKIIERIKTSSRPG